MEKEVKRGYVKWTDENGVFHKEPLADHPELLAKASPEEKLAAEEARRLNAAAEEADKAREDTRDEDLKETLTELKAAPDDVLTAAQLVAESAAVEEVPASGAEEPGRESPEVHVLKSDPTDEEEHERALEELRQRTAAE